MNTATIPPAQKESEVIYNELDRNIRKFLKETIKKNKYDISEEVINLSDFFSDRLLIVLAIKEGLPFSVFNSIQKVSPFSMGEWSDFLDLSTRSLDRYRKANKKFKSVYSEKILEMVEVTKLGLEVFDNPGQFKLWLETPNFALGKHKPIDLLNDSYGKELVISEIVRIDEGIFA